MPTLVPQEVRTLSVRVPEPLYRETRLIAERSKVSINALVNRALAKVVREAQDSEMYEAATLLGEDSEMSDVEFAFGAQAEVVMAHE